MSVFNDNQGEHQVPSEELETQRNTTIDVGDHNVEPIFVCPVFSSTQHMSPRPHISSSSSPISTKLNASAQGSNTLVVVRILQAPYPSPNSSTTINDVNRNLPCTRTGCGPGAGATQNPNYARRVVIRRINNTDSDLSLNRSSTESFQSPSTRGTFLRRVLAIVGLQLLFVATWSLLCIHVVEIGAFVHRVYWITFIALGLYLSLYFAVGLFKLGRSFPSNITILTIYTASLSYICGYVTMQYSTWIVLLTLGVTAATCLTLILVSLVTKLDVTGWGIYLTLAGCIFMLYVLAVFICSFLLKDLQALSILNISGAFFGACLVSVYLLYDLQMIIGGRRAEIDSDQWLFAAMSLFYDIIMIFVYLLQIIGLLKRCSGIHHAHP